MLKKFISSPIYIILCLGYLVIHFIGCPSSLYATASFQVMSNPVSDCQGCNDDSTCSPEDCRDWWASVDFFVNGEKVKHGREELGQNGFSVQDVPVGAEISLGMVGTDKNYTPTEKVKLGENVFKCSGGFWKNCSKDEDTHKDFTCKCWRVK